MRLVATDYVGRPFGGVEAQLVGLGLRVLLVPVSTADTAAGAVTAVDPVGALRPGDQVTVSYAVAPAPSARPAPEPRAQTEEVAVVPAAVTALAPAPQPTPPTQPPPTPTLPTPPTPPLTSTLAGIVQSKPAPHDGKAAKNEAKNKDAPGKKHGKPRKDE